MKYDTRNPLHYLARYGGTEDTITPLIIASNRIALQDLEQAGIDEQFAPYTTRDTRFTMAMLEGLK